MEKVKLVIDGDRLISIDNPFGEKSHDYICPNTFVFEKGKIYGLICEHGGGGESISLLLSNQIPVMKEKIFIDDTEVKAHDVEKLGWYVGKKIYSKGVWKREKSIRQALNDAIKKYQRYESMVDIVEEFHLSPTKMDYGLSKNCEWEMWRASLAIGYVSNKKIYCFPWMDTLRFYDCMYNSSVFRFFKKIIEEGSIIILPTSRKENVMGIADEIIQIHNPRFEHVISDCEYFKKYF